MPNGFRRFAVFYGWTFAIPLILALLFAYYPDPFFPLHGGPFKFVELLQQTMANSGVTMRGGALIPLLSAVSSEPVLVIAAMGSIIPALVAIGVAAKYGGGPAVRALLARLRPWIGVGARSGLRSWLLLFVSLFALQLIVFAAQSMLTGTFGWTVKFNPALQTSAVLLLLLEAFFLNQGGLLEELGFRGYALPALQEVMSPIKAALLLGFAWAIWHVSRDILFATPSQMGFALYLLAYLPLFAIWCIGGSIVMAYFVNRTGGSALAAIAVHGFLNDGALVSGVVEGGNPAGALIVRALVVGLAGLFVFVMAGPQLGRRDAAGA
ncbi:CPBP family intramembrane glutamic endopeptidase [Sphingomonas canadensis]|uniref:CPBP family intramembrane glutamic endopeptidase n=1 Tax=Sphingomonas canadensis TaxID=1219257 RepID=A0ABW3HAD8_9SPHN|nr:CPBP family intramembrane glutamic endopeptidase [Sphingomonas canadensis]MCW3836945.1 CPBP family intramembrane metalloprotease [Sphingomonas canadensis]